MRRRSGLGLGRDPDDQMLNTQLQNTDFAGASPASQAVDDLLTIAAMADNVGHAEQAQVVADGGLLEQSAGDRCEMESGATLRAADR